MDTSDSFSVYNDQVCEKYHGFVKGFFRIRAYRVHDKVVDKDTGMHDVRILSVPFGALWTIGSVLYLLYGKAREVESIHLSRRTMLSAIKRYLQTVNLI